MKKRIVAFLMLIISISIFVLNTSVFATDKSKVSNAPIIHISGSEDILILTEDDIICGYNYSTPNDPNRSLYANGTAEPLSYVSTYNKTITILIMHDDPTTYLDFPQSVWYTETSPIGNTASGDLYLVSYSGDYGHYYVTYSGTLCYYNP